MEIGSIHLITSSHTRDTAAMAVSDHRLTSWQGEEETVHGARWAEVKHWKPSPNTESYGTEEGC